MFKASDLGRVRERTLGDLSVSPVGGIAKFYLFGNLYQTTVYPDVSFRGFERTEDATHPLFIAFMRADRRFRQSAFQNQMFRYILKTGGDFKSTKTQFLDPVGTEISCGTTGGNRVTFNGRVSPVQPSIIQAAPNPTSDSFLMDLGAKQILYNLPDKPLVGVAQTLAELKREGLPRVRALADFRSYSPRKGGEDYLSWQFGFRPVIQDIYDLADSIDTADKQWRSLVKGAGKLQRRHFEFPIERSTTTSVVATAGASHPQLPTTIASGQTSTLYRTRTIVTKRRFSAAYAYHLPPGSESTIAAVRKVQQYRVQYGLELDPALLWELTPWSWLIDWFLPIGNFVSAASQTILGNTALPWAYISEHSVLTDTYERPGVSFAGTQRRLDPVQVSYDYKRRIAASPLGFGLNWDGFSPYQLSILAAIGITR